MNRRVQAVILCEDLQQDVFFSRLLKLLGYRPRNIRVIPYPDGEGCGEQHVRQRYPVEVHVYRTKAQHRAGCLVSIIDADTEDVSFRHRQLIDSLTGNGQNDRRSDENIAIFIPKRYIETWIHYLVDGGAVDENHKYPKLTRHESDCHPAVERFIELAKQSPSPTDCPPSMLRGFVELQRIPQ